LELAPSTAIYLRSLGLEPTPGAFAVNGDLLAQPGAWKRKFEAEKTQKDFSLTQYGLFYSICRKPP
jgi:hypothetical protein